DGIEFVRRHLVVLVESRGNVISPTAFLEAYVVNPSAVLARGIFDVANQVPQLNLCARWCWVGISFEESNEQHLVRLLIAIQQGCWRSCAVVSVGEAHS